MADSPKQPRTPAELDRLRKNLLADADTARIAKGVGMTLEAYVELVLDFAANPNKEPQLHVVSDEANAPPEARKSSMAEVKKFMEDVVAGRATLDPLSSSGFEAQSAERRYESVIQKQATNSAPAVTSSQPGLAEDIARRRKGDVGS